MPVIETATVAWLRSSAPRAISRAVSSLTAPRLRSVSRAPRATPASRAGIGDEAAIEPGRGTRHRGDHLRAHPPARFGGGEDRARSLQPLPEPRASSSIRRRTAAARQRDGAAGGDEVVGTSPGIRLASAARPSGWAEACRCRRRGTGRPPRELPVEAARQERRHQHEGDDLVPDHRAVVGYSEMARCPAGPHAGEKKRRNDRKDHGRMQRPEQRACTAAACRRCRARSAPAPRRSRTR